MPGHLVVVVHGIGEQEAGETVDAVLAGAIADHERETPNHPVTVETEVMQVPDRPFEVGDLPKNAKKSDREVGHFPMHLRHVRSVDQPSAPATTLVDMYWADISPAPKGQWNTILDFVRTLLGIGYLALGNVRGHGTRFSYFLVTAFVWTFFALIASINLMLLIGLGLLLLEGEAYEIVNDGPLVQYARVLDSGVHFKLQDKMVLAIAGILTASVGFLLLLYARKSQLMTQFSSGLLGVGLVVLVLAVLSFGPDNMMMQSLSGLDVQAVEVTEADGVSGSETDNSDEARAEPEYDYLTHFIRVVVRALNLVWLCALALCLMMYATSAFEARQAKRAEERRKYRAEDKRRRREAEGHKPYASHVYEKEAKRGIDPPHESTGPVRIYASVCSAVILLWMVFASSFWVFVEALIGNQAKESGQGLNPNTSQQDETAARQPELAQSNSQETSVEETANELADQNYVFDLASLLETELAEALGGMTMGISLFTGLVVLIFVIAIRRNNNKHNLHERHFEGDRRVLLNGWVQVAFAITTPLITVTAAAHFLKINGAGEWKLLTEKIETLRIFDGWASVALLILAGIIFYFHDAVGRALGVIRDITVYSTTKRREHWPNKTKPPMPENFPIRHKIETRFTRVLNLMLWSKQPDRVTIVSHSLGTIVATRCLGQWLKENSLPNGTLITMGSPVTHIYRRYFPQNFEVKSPLLTKMAWINIFRSDDFVGTWVDGLNREVDNIQVPPAGHSGYFIDVEVWRHLREQAGLTLMDRPAGSDTDGPEPSDGEDSVSQDQDADPTGGEDDRPNGHLSPA